MTPHQCERIGGILAMAFICFWLVLVGITVGLAICKTRCVVVADRFNSEVMK